MHYKRYNSHCCLVGNPTVVPNLDVHKFNHRFAGVLRQFFDQLLDSPSISIQLAESSKLRLQQNMFVDI